MGRDLVIPVTAEMIALFDGLDELDVYVGDTVPAILRDLLAIVERDHLRPAGPDRCSACGRTSHNLTPVTELVDGRTTVVARLGPSCYRDHLRAGAGRQALPIGGTQ
jgi:hypothetical protein